MSEKKKYLNTIDKCRKEMAVLYNEFRNQQDPDIQYYRCGGYLLRNVLEGLTKGELEQRIDEIERKLETEKYRGMT